MDKIPKEDTSKLENFIKKMQMEEPSFLHSNCSYEMLLNNYNYILTEKAKERLDKLYTYITKGIPVILEGETGTSKTLSAEIICKYIYEQSNKKEKKDDEQNDEEKMYIKYNLSSDVKITDLMLKLMGDENYLSGMKKVEGKFFKAFKEGIPLILDEINLASQDVLQCIEDALDSKVINIEIPNIGMVQQEMNKGFCLIATQNPNKDKYSNKRQSLSKSFLSHFQIIKFPPFEIDELKEIAEQLFRSFNGGKEGDEKDKQFLLDLIDFHNTWTSKETVKNEIICFTIREIAASVKAYIDEKKENAFKIVKVIYGSRYRNKEKIELIDLLGKYESFKFDYQKFKKNGISFEIPGYIKGIYKNKTIIEVFDSSLFSLNKGRNIIIVGEEGSGKSKIARWIVKIYNSKDSRSKDYYHYICTEETKCSDLIGYHSPKISKDINNNENILEWKEGFLIESIKKGNIVILDNLQESNSTVTERLNGLLDFKYDENKKKDDNKRKFDVPENPLESSITIHENFRIIGICNINQLSKMSPAFLNRFDIISLEDQLENIGNEEFNNLTKSLFNCDEEKNLDIEDSFVNFLQNSFENENSLDISKNDINKSIIKDNETFAYLCDKLKLMNNKSIQEKKKYSIQDMARFCYSLNIFLKMEKFKQISKPNLIDFVYDLIFEENILLKKIDSSFTQIKKILLQLFKEKYSKEKEDQNKNPKQKNFDLHNEFIYENNNTLETFFAIIYASFLIHLHLCIIGPTGVGKTSSAKFIARILQGENNYKIFPFHRTTTPKELYGTLNVREGKIEEYKGPLAESACKGYIFIADEMNLSSKSTMNSIVPILDPLLDKNINIPSIDKRFNVSENFFFMACQNNFDNLGRNLVPENLNRKLRIIYYPKQKDDEIIYICKEKINKEFKNRQIFNESNDIYLGKFMNEYNNCIENNNYFFLKKWSFRDIDKIIKRISSHIESEDFLNFKYYHFIYFYLFSSIPKMELEKKYKNETLKVKLHSIFSKAFQLNEKDSKELFDIFFNSKARIDDIKSSFIKKGKLGIKIHNLEDKMKDGNFNDSLSNYYDDFFKLKLISKNEPIILMGPSSYKTHLAKFYIKNENPSLHDNFKIIYLNQKTTIEELLGSPNFYSSKESKYFNLDLLCKICHMELLDLEKKNILENVNEIKYFKEKIKKFKINPIITEIIDNIYNNMINNENKKPTIEFEPGSILLSILRQESLIFENIHQVSTEVFERFNELFGTEGILSLNEDIYQTFFSEQKKEQFKQIIKLKEFNDNNIIFIGTCPENSFQSLSETILSRFSVICVEEHEDFEKEKIIKKLCHGISKKYCNSIIQNFKFGEFKDIKKIKNLIGIFSKMNKNNSIYSNFGQQIIDNNFGYINSYIQLNKNNTEIDPIYKKKENILKYDNDYIYSKASKLRIKTEKQPKMETEKEFTPLFNNLNDLIHFGICTFTPLIFECSSGQGKQSSINYVCDLLNYEIENIVITNTFTVNDLFKKTKIDSTNEDNIKLSQIPTKLFSKVKNKNEHNNIYDNNDKNGKKIMFVFHNINKAESDVLSNLTEIFNEDYENSDYSLIGLININEGLIDRETYYHNLFPKAIYYRIPPLTYSNIGEEKICNLNFTIDYYSEKQNINNIFTLNDISKYKKLKEVSKIEDSFLEDIIFKNKFLIYNNENKQLKKNRILSKLTKCDFNYLNNTKEFIMEVNNKSFSLMAEEKLKNFEEEKNTLSFEQKKCLIFLGLSVKSNIPCIIQGSTGVGKSHLIKLFAKFLGKKLHIFELNKDNQISLLTKYYIFKDYDEEEKDYINYILPEIDGNQNNNQIDIDKRYAQIKKNYENLNKEKRKLFSSLISKYSLIKRFKYTNSEFLDAVINGEWVLLDGIENSPSFIAEKIALLCGEKPELNLYEEDKEPIRPHQEFHLFITYNPERVNNNNLISNSLFDKCLVYNLESFANERISISQIIHGFLVNSLSTKDKDILYDIASRLSNLHFIIKENLNKNNFNEITERTLINFCKTIRKEIDDLHKNIKENYLYFYFPSLDKKKREDYFKLINENIIKKGTQFEALATHFKIECKELLSLLSSYVENDFNDENEYQIFFAQFLNHFLNMPFKYINELKSSISDDIIKNKKNNLKNNKYIFVLFIDYINKINNILEINKENINNDSLRDKINEFPIIKKLILYEELNRNNLIVWNWMNSLIENINIFRQIEDMHKFQSIESLHNFLETMSNNISLIQNIIKIFPYSKFRKTNFNTINPILKYIFQNSSINKINFKIKLESQIYDFKYQEEDKIKLILNLKLNNNNKLLISEKSEVYGKDFSSFNKKYNEDQINNFNLRFFKQIFSDNEIKIKNVKQYYKNAKNNIDEEIDIIIERYSLKLFFDQNGNIIINSWSILFINNKQLIENYLPYFLKSENDKNNIESNIFYLTFILYNNLFGHKDFNKIKDTILEISKLISHIINEGNYLYNLSFDENYIINMNLKTTKEIEQVIKDLDIELNKINKIIHMIKDIGISFPSFTNYSKMLMGEKNRLNDEKKKIRNDNYKKSIKEKIEKEMNFDKDLIENLKKKIDEINDFEELKDFDELVDNYIIRYSNKDELGESKIFYKDGNISLENFKNKNIMLIEILLKFSKIKDLIEEIKVNKETKLISIQKIFELIDKKYFELFLSVLFVSIKNEIFNDEKNIILESTLYSILVKEIVDNELIQNFVNFPNLVNNLYNINSSGEINNEWCWNIEKRYYFNTKIYIPEINNLSFLYLFIRIKDLKSIITTKGILIDNEDNDLFDNFKTSFGDLNLLRDKNQLKDLILKIGNLLFNSYFKEKVENNDSLTKKIIEKLNLNSTSDKGKYLLGQFLKYKYLYENAKNEKLIFDELMIENKKDKSKLFTNKYPSLINFLNNNNKIYCNLIKESSIVGFSPKNQEKQFIPLWLLCL